MFNFFSKSKSINKNKYIFGLILKEDEGNGLILEVDYQQKKIRKIGEKKFLFSNSWQQIVEDVDEVLFELEKVNKIRLEKTIFFLYSHLIDQDNKEIRKPYLDKVKHLVRELELKPLGYIECHEVLPVYYKKKEEAPLTSIIIELDKSSLSLFIYKGGEFKFSDSIARTENLITDLDSVFSKIKGEIILPSRIIIYNSSKLEEESDKIISHRWSEALFIQIPRIEILKYEELKEALIFSFSQQTFGDSETKMIEKKKDEVLGFIIGKDIADELGKKQQIQILESESQEKPPSFFKWPVPKIKFSFKFQTAYLLLIGVLLIMSSIFSVFYFIHKVSLIIYFQGKKIEKQLDIITSFEAPVSKNELLLKKIDEMVEKEDSIVTTGKQFVGDKARGEVTIYNSSLIEKEFKKGALLTTDDGIKFILENDIKVASASQNLTSDGNLLTVTGKTKAKITANDIGPSGNIDNNEKLKIEDYPLNLIFAIPNASLVGGTKQEIQTVSKEDMKKLKDLLIEKIKTDGNSIIKSKIENSQIIDKLTKIEISEEHFSQELGEKAKKLSLKTKGEITFYTFSKDDMKQVIIDSLINSISSNYELLQNNINYVLKDVQDKDSKMMLSIEASAKMIIKTNKRQIFQALMGKSFNEAGRIIKEKFNAQGYEIKVEYNIPFLKSRLPFFEKNIDLRIKSI